MTVPLHSLELLPDEAGQDTVLRDWQALRDAGLPSQLDHRGATNAPHLTVVAAPAIAAALCGVAADALGPLLPVEVRASGLLLLGDARVTVARVVDVGEPLLRAVVAVRAATRDLPVQGWLPHVTIARRVPRSDVARVLDVLDPDPGPLRLTTLRRWDPEVRTVTVLAGPGAAPPD